MADFKALARVALPWVLLLVTAGAQALTEVTTLPALRDAMRSTMEGGAEMVVLRSHLELPMDSSIGGRLAAFGLLRLQPNEDKALWGDCADEPPTDVDVTLLAGRSPRACVLVPRLSANPSPSSYVITTEPDSAARLWLSNIWLVFATAPAPDGVQVSALRFEADAGAGEPELWLSRVGAVAFPWIAFHGLSPARMYMADCMARGAGRHAVRVSNARDWLHMERCTFEGTSAPGALGGAVYASPGPACALSLFDLTFARNAGDAIDTCAADVPAAGANAPPFYTDGAVALSAQDFCYRAGTGARAAPLPTGGLSATAAVTSDSAAWLAELAAAGAPGAVEMLTSLVRNATEGAAGDAVEEVTGPEAGGIPANDSTSPVAPAPPASTGNVSGPSEAEAGPGPGPGSQPPTPLSPPTPPTQPTPPTPVPGESNVQVTVLPPRAASVSSNSGGSRADRGLIAGIVVGAVLLVAIAAGAVMWRARRGRGHEVGTRDGMPGTRECGLSPAHGGFGMAANHIDLSSPTRSPSPTAACGPMSLDNERCSLYGGAGGVSSSSVEGPMLPVAHKRAHRFSWLALARTGQAFQGRSLHGNGGLSSQQEGHEPSGRLARPARPVSDCLHHVRGLDASAPAAAGADMTRVHAALDAIDAHFGGQLHKYSIAATAGRTTGGQAVVVYATDSDIRKDVAIKLFAQHAHYQRELALYTGPLAAWAGLKFLEDAVDCAGQALPDGTPLPSYIVMERGQPMTVWLRHKRSAALKHQLLGEVAQQLAAAHAAGYVHRDVQPSNILWLTRWQEWRLIDWATAEPAGSTAPSACIPPYAAPEVLLGREETWRAGKSPAWAPPSDVWALGVVAFEALSGESFVPAGCSMERTMARVLAERPLVNDDDAALWRRMGKAAPLVRRMLSRDPQQRPSAREVHHALGNLTAGKHSFGTYDA